MKYKIIAVLSAATLALSSLTAVSAQTVSLQSAVSAAALAQAPADCPNVKSITPTLKV